MDPALTTDPDDYLYELAGNGVVCAVIPGLLFGGRNGDHEYAIAARLASHGYLRCYLIRRNIHGKELPSLGRRHWSYMQFHEIETYGGRYVEPFHKDWTTVRIVECIKAFADSHAPPSVAIPPSRIVVDHGERIRAELSRKTSNNRGYARKGPQGSKFQKIALGLGWPSQVDVIESRPVLASIWTDATILRDVYALFPLKTVESDILRSTERLIDQHGYGVWGTEKRDHLIRAQPCTAYSKDLYYPRDKHKILGLLVELITWRCTVKRSGLMASKAGRAKLLPSKDASEAESMISSLHIPDSDCPFADGIAAKNEINGSGYIDLGSSGSETESIATDNRVPKAEPNDQNVLLRLSESEAEEDSDGTSDEQECLPSTDGSMDSILDENTSRRSERIQAHIESARNGTRKRSGAASEAQSTTELPIPKVTERSITSIGSKPALQRWTISDAGTSFSVPKRKASPSDVDSLSRLAKRLTPNSPIPRWYGRESRRGSSASESSWINNTCSYNTLISQGIGYDYDHAVKNTRTDNPPRYDSSMPNSRSISCSTRFSSEVSGLLPTFSDTLKDKADRVDVRLRLKGDSIPYMPSLTYCRSTEDLFLTFEEELALSYGTRIQPRAVVRFDPSCVPCGEFQIKRGNPKAFERIMQLISRAGCWEEPKAATCSIEFLVEMER